MNEKLCEECKWYDGGEYVCNECIDCVNGCMWEAANRD